MPLNYPGPVKDPKTEAPKHDLSTTLGNQGFVGRLKFWDPSGGLRKDCSLNPIGDPSTE